MTSTRSGNAIAIRMTTRENGVTNACHAEFITSASHLALQGNLLDIIARLKLRYAPLRDVRVSISHGIDPETSSG